MLATRKAITVRAATNEEGPSIGVLVWRAGFQIEGIDWSDVEPYWLVAVWQGRLVGALQVCMGKPIAHLERLSLEPSLPHRVRALTVKQLLYAGMAACRRAGVQFVTGVIVQARQGFRKVVTRHGAIPLTEGTIYLKRVSD